MLPHHARIALFMKGALTQNYGKMGFGVLRYSPNPVVCVIDPDFAGQDAADVTGIPRPCPVVATVEEARQLGAEVFVLGIAPPGGHLPEDWLADIDEAYRSGLSIVNGLHETLAGRYPDAGYPGKPWVWDIRVEPAGLKPNTGAARHLPCPRILFIGTDMAVGKMTSALEAWRAARAREIDAAFVATGQIGMTITGDGVPLDAVRVDYASGAIEREMLKHPHAEVILVEGQGSLAHPGSTATLPLLRGSMPTHFVLTHRAHQTHLTRFPEIAIPPLKEFVALYRELASVGGIFPRPECLGVALNCKGLSEEEAASACAAIEAETGWPTLDPVRTPTLRWLEPLFPGRI